MVGSDIDHQKEQCIHKLTVNIRQLSQCIHSLTSFMGLAFIFGCMVVFWVASHTQGYRELNWRLNRDPNISHMTLLMETQCISELPHSWSSFLCSLIISSIISPQHLRISMDQSKSHRIVKRSFFFPPNHKNNIHCIDNQRNAAKQNEENGSCYNPTSHTKPL